MAAVEYLRPREACNILRVSYSTLMHWIKEGRIKAVRTPSGRYLIPRREVERVELSSPHASLSLWLSAREAPKVLDAYREFLSKKVEVDVAYEAIKRFATYLLNNPSCRKRMFSVISRTWNPVSGCEHNCVYCWARRLALTKLRFKERYREGFKPRLNKEELKASFDGGVVFVSDMGDLFGDFVPPEWIRKVLDRVRRFKDTLFLFLTKNPERYFEFLDEMPENSILGATIETDDDRLYEENSISKAPKPSERIDAMRRLPWDLKFVSIEPVLDFTEGFAEQIKSTGAFMVYVGYDNYDNRLPEPPLEKVRRLIEELRRGPMIVVEKTMRPSWKEGLKAYCAEEGAPRPT